VGGAAISGKFAAALTANFSLPSFEKQLVNLEKASGGRLGVALLDTATSAQARHRRDERFPMCSTFKLLAEPRRLRKRSTAFGESSRSAVAGCIYSEKVSLAPACAQFLAQWDPSSPMPQNDIFTAN
jgi:hypothetical protein